jgi:hypothetical protein
MVVDAKCRGQAEAHDAEGVVVVVLRVEVALVVRAVGNRRVAADDQVAVEEGERLGRQPLVRGDVLLQGARLLRPRFLGPCLLGPRLLGLRGGIRLRSGSPHAKQHQGKG